MHRLMDGVLLTFRDDCVNGTFNLRDGILEQHKIVSGKLHADNALVQSIIECERAKGRKIGERQVRRALIAPCKASLVAMIEEGERLFKELDEVFRT